MMGGVGDPCLRDDDCRITLACAVDSTCQPTGAGMAGSVCQLTGDCADGLYCGPTRTCETAGTLPEGSDCVSTGDCERGLVCVIEGLGGRCRMPGTSDLGDACLGTRECVAGLACLPQMNGDNACGNPPPSAELGDGGVPTTPPLPLWAGEECEESTGTPEALFRIPRAGTDYDFYSLPFPNDIRRTATGLDLSGHPTPGTALPIDIIDRYLRASETDLDGFGLNPTIYFRFSHPYAWDSTDDRFLVVDVTEGSPTYGEAMNVSWFRTFGRISRYICDDWFAMRALHGLPFRPATTYAAILETGIAASPDAGGEPFARSNDFEAMMASSAPSDPAVQSAWNAYGPLRAWLAAGGMLSDGTSVTAPDVLVAAVFTTQDPDRVPRALRDVVRGRAPATVSDLVACDSGVTSPCDDGTEERRCSAANAAFDEIHGHIELPIFQQGTPPYEEPEDGGGIVLDASNRPMVQRSEQVCFALTVPKENAPPGGFPLLVVGHGTGGSFTGAVTSGLAEDAATGNLGGVAVHAATLSIDFPEHGARRGASTRSPEVLFFNFANPRAARDNILQGTADLYGLVHFATSSSIPASASPTGAAISFDPTKIVFFMHSQGSTHAALMIGNEPDVRAIVFSGNGGDLVQSLLHKTEPVDIAHILPIALLDPTREGTLSTGDFHPALAIFQAYFDRVDPVNFARRLHRERYAGLEPHDVFMTYGLGDSYSPEPTLQAYSYAASLPLVRPLLGDGWRLFEVDAPLDGNFGTDPDLHTIGLRQYDPSTAGVDGHFVALRTSAGRADTIRFLLGALAGQVPTIGAP